ncbi:MAG: tetratricopeptide repeat protein [Burkholderiales bacterium]
MTAEPTPGPDTGEAAVEVRRVGPGGSMAPDSAFAVALLALWHRVAQAGGAVGFLPSVDRSELGYPVSRVIADLRSGRAYGYALTRGRDVIGFVLLEQGQSLAAIERLQQALALRRPSDDFAHEAQYLLGRAHAAADRPHQALAAFDAALQLRPEFAEPLEESVRMLLQLHRPAEAVSRAQQLLKVRPQALTRVLLATALIHVRQHAQAAAILDQVCAEDPANLDAGALHFEALLQSGRAEDALAEARRLLALAGAHPATLVSLSVALERTGRHEEALAHIGEAQRLGPPRRDARVKRVSVLTQLLRVREAVAAAQASLAIYPDDADLHWSLSIAYLLLGDFQHGWHEHEWRHRSGAFRGTLLELKQPRWEGQSLAGRAIFLYGEQGFGDNIQFVRYLPQIAQQAATVYLQVLEPLEPLMRELPPNCRLLRQGALLPAIDYHCPFMSLPAVLGTNETNIPAAVPYLHADPASAQAWRKRLPRDTLNVGIAWSGKLTHVNDHNRSMTLQLFRALSTDGCRFVTIQPQLREADRAGLEAWAEALDFGGELHDFADTAALVQALDLVVSVDTSVAHLAGALGKPVWILLPHVPDWRWMLERPDSPWYPSARLYRQPAPRDWASVVDSVRRDLLALCAAR